MYALVGYSPLGKHLDRDRDTRSSEPSRLRAEVHDVADLNGGEELDAVDDRRDPTVGTVPTSLDVASLIDMRQNDAAEDRTFVICVPWHHHDAKGGGRNFVHYS